MNVEICPTCHNPIPNDRHGNGGFCSRACRKAAGYYDNGQESALLEALYAGLQGTTAWMPQALEPVQQIVSGFPVTIFSDIHCPMHDAKLLYQGIQVAKHFNSEILLLNGDVLDLNQISRHMGGYYRRKAELDDDFEAAEHLLKILCREFKTVYWLSGNHCIERLIKLFRGEVKASRLLKVVGDFPNLKITSRSFVDINEHVRICHPRQYGRVRGSLAQRLAQRWQKHIGTGHQHHAAMSYSPDGKWQAVDIPCMVQVDLQDYVRNELNDFPEPMKGFAMVFGNYIQVFTPDFPFSHFGVKL